MLVAARSGNFVRGSLITADGRNHTGNLSLLSWDFTVGAGGPTDRELWDGQLGVFNTARPRWRRGLLRGGGLALPRHGRRLRLRPAAGFSVGRRRGAGGFPRSLQEPP